MSYQTIPSEQQQVDHYTVKRGGTINNNNDQTILNTILTIAVYERHQRPGIIGRIFSSDERMGLEGKLGYFKLKFGANDTLLSGEFVLLNERGAKLFKYNTLNDALDFDEIDVSEAVARGRFNKIREALGVYQRYQGQKILSPREEDSVNLLINSAWERGQELIDGNRPNRNNRM